MQPAPIPSNERARLDALHALEILDTPPDEQLDELVGLVANLCKTPIALVSLVDERRQWFKSKVGLDLDETERELSFCGHAIAQDEVFEVPDATDPRGAQRGCGLCHRYVPAHNLLGNALKFTQQGWVRLHACVDPEFSANGKVRFGVADSGAGMTPDVLSHLSSPITPRAAPVAARGSGS